MTTCNPSSTQSCYSPFLSPCRGGAGLEWMGVFNYLLKLVEMAFLWHLQVSLVCHHVQGHQIMKFVHAHWNNAISFFLSLTLQHSKVGGLKNAKIHIPRGHRPIHPCGGSFGLVNAIFEGTITNKRNLSNASKKTYIYCIYHNGLIWPYTIETVIKCQFQPALFIYIYIYIYIFIFFYLANKLYISKTSLRVQLFIVYTQLKKHHRFCLPMSSQWAVEIGNIIFLFSFHKPAPFKNFKASK
jgi:hypothetical protein